MAYDRRKITGYGIGLAMFLCSFAVDDGLVGLAIKLLAGAVIGITYGATTRLPDPGQPHKPTRSDRSPSGYPTATGLAAGAALGAAADQWLDAEGCSDLCESSEPIVSDDCAVNPANGKPMIGGIGGGSMSMETLLDAHRTTAHRLRTSDD